MRNGRKLEGLNRRTSSKRLGLMLVKTGLKAGYDEKPSPLAAQRKPVMFIAIND